MKTKHKRDKAPHEYLELWEKLCAQKFHEVVDDAVSLPPGGACMKIEVGSGEAGSTLGRG